MEEAALKMRPLSSCNGESKGQRGINSDGSRVLESAGFRQRIGANNKAAEICLVEGELGAMMTVNYGIGK